MRLKDAQRAYDEQLPPEYWDDSDECECGGDGCPSCMECGGIYSPGTEECDFCKFSDECDI